MKRTRWTGKPSDVMPGFGRSENLFRYGPPRPDTRYTPEWAPTDAYSKYRAGGKTYTATALGGLGITFAEQVFGKDAVAKAQTQALVELKKLGKTIGEEAAPSIAEEARAKTADIIPWVLGGVLAVMFIGGTLGGLAAARRSK